MSTLMKFVFGANVLQFEEGADYPAPRSIEKLQVFDRSSGGKIHAEDLGITLRQRVLNFNDMLKIDHDNLKNWFDNVVNGIEFEFEFTDERGHVGIVKIMDNVFNFSENDFELFSGTLTLEYQ